MASSRTILRRVLGGAPILRSTWVKPTRGNVGHLRPFVVVTQTAPSPGSNNTPLMEVSSPVAPPPQSTSTETTVATEKKASQNDIEITDTCWQRIAQLASDNEQYLRVFVDAGGCSGFSYQFELDREPPAEDDCVFCHPNNARVVIDQASLDILRGSTLDYVQSMIKSSFEVLDNPQSESACGCGSSFAIKNFAANSAAH